MNSKLVDLVGQYTHINKSLEIADENNKLVAKGKGKGHQYDKLVLNDKNTLFTDVEVVQRSIVKVYGITPEGKYHCVYLVYGKWVLRSLLVRNLGAIRVPSNMMLNAINFYVKVRVDPTDHSNCIGNFHRDWRRSIDLCFKAG